MNTYLIVSKYLIKERIETYFQPLGWTECKDKNPTLLYLDGMNIYYFKHEDYKSLIKNQIGEDKNLFTNKNYLHLIVPKDNVMTTYLYNTKNNLNEFKNIFKNNKKWILKPSRGREGIGIKIVKNFNELENFYKHTIKKINFKQIKDKNQWVIQEYIDKPILYENRKFHLRVYFLIVDKKIYYFSKYLIATAEQEYVEDRYFDKKIHDSHYNEKSIRNRLFPDDFEIEIDKLNKINKDINSIFKYLKTSIVLPFKCYKEDKNCYEIFSADIMITSDYDVKVIEFNHSTGYPETMDKKYPLFENQLDIVLKHFKLINKKDEGKLNYFIKV